MASIDPLPAHPHAPESARPTYAERVAELYAILDGGGEPSDAALESLAEYGDADAERDLAQLFYRRALVREDQLEREEEADWERRRLALIEADGGEPDES